MPTTVTLQAGVGVERVADNLIRFFPRLVWSLLVLAAGVGVARVVSGRAEGAVEDSTVVADALAAPFAYGVRLLLYFFAATIALGELGVDTSVLVVFLDGVAFGLGVTVALALGVAVGWGSKDYVAAHVEEWLREVTANEGDADGGGDEASESDDDDGGNDAGADDANDEGASDGDEDAGSA